MRSNATTVDEYLATLPADRRATIVTVRKTILANLPKGIIETIGYGMISYVVPFEKTVKTYNGMPLMMVALASEKNYCSLHLMCIYMNDERANWLKREFEAAGKKLKMGKACIRFQRADDLALKPIGELIAKTSPAKLLEAYQASHSKEARAKRSKERKSSTKK